MLPSDVNLEPLASRTLPYPQKENISILLLQLSPRRAARRRSRELWLPAPMRNLLAAVVIRTMFPIRPHSSAQATSCMRTQLLQIISTSSS
jgi:hypothetical protein